MNNIHADISIVIPCFNTQVNFLQQAVESIYKYTGSYSYEVIICDDGSTNKATLQLLNEFKKEDIIVVHQSNKGPAAARNTGVKNSHSNFILFLDSDNKILPDYIDEGINALKANSKAAMVYGNPAFFGEQIRRDFKPEAFDIKKILLKNYIDTCCVMRKKAWDDLGGMDEADVLIGCEDWELWINLYKAAWEFIYINKPMYQYRIRKNSLMGSASDEKIRKAIQYIYGKHWEIIYEIYHQLYVAELMYKTDMQKPFYSFFKYSKKKFLS